MKTFGWFFYFFFLFCITNLPMNSGFQKMQLELQSHVAETIRKDSRETQRKSTYLQLHSSNIMLD